MTLLRYQNQLPDLLGRFFDDDSLESWSNRNYSEAGTTLPKVNIKENNDAFDVEVAVPGFDKKDFNIKLDNGVLTVSSEKKEEKTTKDDEKYSRREFSYQSFTRTFTLPELVDGNKISAKYTNGILKINIPKKEEAKPKPPKQIKIS